MGTTKKERLWGFKGLWGKGKGLSTGLGITAAFYTQGSECARKEQGYILF